MNSSQCALFRELSHNVEYHVIVAVKGTLGTAGAVRVAMQWRNYGVRFLVHKNTKMSFRFYFALNILLGSVFGFIYLCELIRCVGISTIIAAHQLIVIISFERLYSTIYPAHFEKHSSKALAAALALTMIIFSYIYSMMMMSDNFRLFQRREVALLNESQPENRAGFEILMTSLALGNCLSLLMLCFDLYLNFQRKPKNASPLSLGVSYQLSENRRIILTLLPIEITQSIMGLFASTALLIPNPTPIGQQIFLELVTSTTFFPLILTIFIKRSVEKNSNRSPPIDPVVDHFESLQRSWNA